MDRVIAKRYVKALVSTLDDDSLSSASDSLRDLTSAFLSPKFRDIINSSDVLNDKIEEFILSIANSSDEKLINFLKLLIANKRVADIPAISKELDRELAFKKGEFDGLLISNFKVNDSDLRDIESKISAKLKSKINLENRVTDYPGLKVEIDDLGVEVGLSTDRLKSQLAEHILRAI